MQNRIAHSKKYKPNQFSFTDHKLETKNHNILRMTIYIYIYGNLLHFIHNNSRDTRWNPNMNMETSMTQSHSSKAMSNFVGLSPNKPNIRGY